MDELTILNNISLRLTSTGSRYKAAESSLSFAKGDKNQAKIWIEKVIRRDYQMGPKPIVDDLIKEAVNHIDALSYSSTRGAY